MRVSIFELANGPSETAQERALLLGLAAKLMSEHGASAQYQHRYWKDVVTRAIDQHRIRFYFDDSGQPIAYVIWALLDEEVAARVSLLKRFTLHKSEWNEGNEAWIVDLIVKPGHGKKVLLDIARQFQGFGALRYFKSTRCGQTKVIDRRVVRHRGC